MSHHPNFNNFLHQRYGYSYSKTLELAIGNTLQIIDKNISPFIFEDKSHKRVSQPEELRSLPDQVYNTVVIFHTIEHVYNDHEIMRECMRILKPNGKLIITTQNKEMALSCNPRHAWEYYDHEFSELLNKYFHVTDMLGVFGNERIDEYQRKNKISVNKIRKFDLFNLEHKLPNWMLRIPYAMFSTLNRKKLFSKNKSLVSGIDSNDFSLKPIMENSDLCLDLFYVAIKDNNKTFSHLPPCFVYER